ncbi:hypothetical protein PG997_002253 [Apiospora hydei]|uniref:Uncharacterized protein n=1 Tax=Apiospora hydei TaxID=1337664 RepID=A0ABR1X8V4_9PEZI
MHAITVFLAVLSLAAKALGAPTNTSIERRFEGGWCGLHIHVEVNRPYLHYTWLTIKVYDGKKAYVNEGDFKEPVDKVMFGSIGGHGLPMDLSFEVDLRKSRPRIHREYCSTCIVKPRLAHVDNSSSTSKGRQSTGILVIDHEFETCEKTA